MQMQEIGIFFCDKTQSHLEVRGTKNSVIQFSIKTTFPPCIIYKIRHWK